MTLISRKRSWSVSVQIIYILKNISKSLLYLAVETAKEQLGNELRALQNNFANLTREHEREEEARKKVKLEYEEFSGKDYLIISNRWGWKKAARSSKSSRR